MMRFVMLLGIISGLLMFLAFFGGGMGYAFGGGEVRIFSSWAEAHSANGQAIAVSGDVENLNASNTSPPPAEQTRGQSTFDQIVGIFCLVIIFAGGGFWMYVHLQGKYGTFNNHE